MRELDGCSETRQVVVVITKFCFFSTLPPGSSWLKLNVGVRGYYRVNYPASDWAAFAKSLSESPHPSSLFPTVDRTGLLADAFAMAGAGRLPYSAALGLTRYMAQKENDLAPWQVVLDTLANLTGTLRATSARGPLRSYQLWLCSRLRADLGWSDEGATEKRLLRSAVLNASCRCGDGESRAAAKKRLMDWKDGGSRVSPNLRGVVYKHGMKEVRAKTAVLFLFTVSIHVVQVKYYIGRSSSHDILGHSVLLLEGNYNYTKVC